METTSVQTNEPLHVFWSQDYVLESDVETRRKSGPLAALLKSGEIANIELVEPAPITRTELLAIHESQYIDELATKNVNLARSIFASTGGVRDAVDAMFEFGKSGSLSSGLHHARPDGEYGLCYLNGLALAALRAIQIHQIGNIGVLDLDAHCGGGTFTMLGENPNVTLADVSCNSFDSWLPNSNRHYLEVISDGREYLDAVKRSLAHLKNVDALIYNAGMDPFEDDGMGGMKGITREVLAERERLVAQWCEDHQKPAMFVLAGGYCGSKLDIDGLARMHLMTIKEFARIQINSPRND